MRGDRRRVALPDFLVDRAAPVDARPGGDVPVCAGVRLERVPAGPVSLRGHSANVTLCHLLSKCYTRATMVEYVGADPDYDPAGDRYGDCAGALHLARAAGGRRERMKVKGKRQKAKRGV